jgi:CRP/FNR family cyclic AMP-dependent transcriptional regulator
LRVKRLFPSAGPYLGESLRLPELEKSAFDAEAFLASAGLGRRIVQLSEEQNFFSQGEAADSVFYLQSGRAKLIVASRNGKKATITLLAAGDFVGEESLASAGTMRMASATSITKCTALKIEREEMLRAMYKEHSLAETLIEFLLARGMRIQSDLVDQLLNSSEKRLAKILVLMAGLGELGEVEKLIPEITEESLGEMIGTSQSSVSFFMNRFRELGFIDYDGGIRVHKALLSAILHDRLPGDNTATPEIAGRAW